MWDPLVEPDDDWQPLRTRRARSIRLTALVVAAVMVLVLVIPVLIRLMRSSDAEAPQDDTVVALVVSAAVDAHLERWWL